MYSKYNEGKLIVPERFVWTLKSEIYKHAKLRQKMLILIVLYDIVDE